MKIDLSKYPLGTKFKLYNEKIVTLIGKSFVNDDYVIEFPNGDLRHRNQEGKYSAQSEWNIASVVQPDKYLVSYLTEQGKVDTIVLPISNPNALNEAVLLPIIKLKTSSMLDIISEYSERAVKILSWSKIEE